MDDLKKQAQNVDVPADDVTTSPVVEEVTANSQASEDAGEPEAGDVEPERKPTKRAERRIRDFAERTRRLSEENERLKSQFLQRGQPTEEPYLFDAGESEIDPQELQARIDRFVDAKLERKLSERDAKSREIENYTRTFDEHSHDLESIALKYPELDSENGGDPILEEQFVSLYNRLNTKLLPDGREVYVPNVKATDVAEMVLNIKRSVLNKEVASFTGKTMKQEMERAIAPSTSSASSERNYEIEELRNSARETGDERLWAQYLKKTGIAKVQSD